MHDCVNHQRGPVLTLRIDLRSKTYLVIPEVGNGGAEDFEVALASALENDGMVGRLLRLLPQEQITQTDHLFRMPGFDSRVGNLRQRG